jgi:hypothetical protein
VYYCLSLATEDKGDFMGILKKGKRKIIRNDRVFYWWVGENDDDDRLHLSIASDDKSFIVDYMLGQKDASRMFSPKEPLIIVKGKWFKGLSDCGGCWKRFLVPEWEDDIITPSLVAEIIDWCYVTEPVIQVDYRGECIETGA